MRLFLTVIFSSLIMISCSAFSSSKKMNMQPFSDNAGVLFTQAAKVSRPYQFKILKPYTDLPEYTSLLQRAAPLLAALKGISYYSYQVVAINNSKLSDKQKASQLASYLRDTFEKSKVKKQADSLSLSDVDVEKTLLNIKMSNNYLEAISSANPLINAIVRALYDRLDLIQADIPQIILAFEKEMEKEFSVTRANYRRLTNLQEETIATLTRLYQAESVNRGILDTLLMEDQYLSNFIRSSKQVTQNEFAAAEKYLVKRLDEIDMMINQMEYVKKEYIAKKNELIAWHAQVDEEISIARNAITVWSQSHRNLGQGIPVPPMIDIAGIAGSLVGGAAKAVVP